MLKIMVVVFTVILSLLFFLYPGFCDFSVYDALNRKIDFNTPPMRITLAGRGVLMLLDAVYIFPQAQSRIVAVERITQGRGDFFNVIEPHFNEKIIMAPEPGPEEILATNPELVIMKSYMEGKLGRILQELGVKVLYLNLETPDQYERDIYTLGLVFQNPARAQEIIDFYRENLQKVEKVKEKINQSEKPRILFLYYNNRDGQIAFNVPPSTWIQTIMVELGGGNPIWKEKTAAKGWVKVGFEQIASWDADQIYITAYFSDVEKIVKSLYTDPLWKSIPAVKKGKLYAFPGDYYNWDQPDTRWILGFLWIAKKINPDAFNSIDLIEESRIFFEKLYRIDDEKFKKYIKPLLTGDIE